MSKRRNRKQSPNLPPEMLERARQQLSQDGTEAADVEDESDDEVEEVKTVEPAPVKAAVKTAPASTPAKAPAPAPRAASSARATTGPRSRSSRRTGLQPAQSRGGERKSDAADTKYVRNRLANPTRFVSTDELKAEYSYVISDLRTMFGLAAVLLVVMVVLEKLLGG